MGGRWFSKGDLRIILDDAFLNALAKHMCNTNTLLARILMLLEENGNYYVVMNNWFPDGGDIFDLKGSYNNRYKRKFSDETLVPTESEWKDLDFITFMEKYPVLLQHTPKIQGVFRAIYDDLLFLNEWNVVDYSLLIQIKLAGSTPVVRGFDEYDAKAMSAQVMYGTIRDEVYEFHFGGFIDFLSTYKDWGKKAEATFKPGIETSASANPERYMDRFCAFFDNWFRVCKGRRVTGSLQTYTPPQTVLRGRRHVAVSHLEYYQSKYKKRRDYCKEKLRTMLEVRKKARQKYIVKGKKLGVRTCETGPAMGPTRMGKKNIFWSGDEWRADKQRERAQSSTYDGTRKASWSLSLRGSRGS